MPSTSGIHRYDRVEGRYCPHCDDDFDVNCTVDMEPVVPTVTWECPRCGIERTEDA